MKLKRDSKEPITFERIGHLLISAMGVAFIAYAGGIDKINSFIGFILAIMLLIVCFWHLSIMVREFMNTFH